jgi:hypothetical protein
VNEPEPRMINIDGDFIATPPPSDFAEIEQSTILADVLAEKIMAAQSVVL